MYKITIILLNDDHSKELETLKYELAQYNLSFTADFYFTFKSGKCGKLHKIELCTNNYVYIYCDEIKDKNHE